MSEENISILLQRLSEVEEVYAKAKSDLVEVQRKLHGLSYKPKCKRDQNGRVSQSQSKEHVIINVKRGRGRPKKVKPAVEFINNMDNNCTNRDDLRIVENESEMDMVRGNQEEENIPEEGIEDQVDFTDAVYTYVDGCIYIETKYRNYYDIKTLELRGWYNPYTYRHEWL